MVDKCPNCGQPSRPGARFCTSCGFRLPERPVEPEPSPLTRSPFATTSTVAASWWPSSAPSGEPETSATDSAGPSTEETPGGEEVPAAEAASAGASEESVDEAPTTEEFASEPTPTETDPFADWPSSPTYESPAAPPSHSWESPTTAAATDSAPTATDRLAAAVDEMAGDDAPIPLGAPLDAGEEKAVSADEIVSGTPSWLAEPAAEPSPESPTEAAVQPADGDGLARARSLLDELGALLPSLAAPAATGPSPDVAAVTAALASARDEAAGQQDQLEALMAVVETARSRPRDIDVMLDLSRQVEAIVALKAGYDRCRDAIETALGQLRTDQSA